MKLFFDHQKRIFALLGIITGLILVQACGRQLTPETSCNFVQNQNLQRVSWGSNTPVNIYMDSSYPAEYVIALTGAIAQWNNIGQQLSKKDFFRLRTGSPGASSPRQDGYTKIYMLNTWEDDRRIEQARTTVYWSGSQIYESDIRINHKDYDFYLADDRPDYSKVHLESLIVHELGHVLGLAHTHNTESVMQVSLANGKVREEPQSPDIEALQCEY